MKKIVLLFTVLVLFAGCKHRKAIRVEDETPQNSEESFVLHPTIMAAIKEFGLSNHTDRIYAVYFTDTNDGFTMLKQDTLIYLSFLEETPLIDANYKGILDIDSLSVAIFDKNSCGNNFYDSTKLSTIPLSNLKKIPEHEIKPVAAWGVQADSVIRWVAP